MFPPNAAARGLRLFDGHPRVLMCYAHESEEHKDDVWALAECLHDAGVSVIIDVDAWPNRCDWQIWTTANILTSDYVLAVASSTCRKAGDGTIDHRLHRGLQAEMRTLRDLCTADYPTWSRRILPVVLPDMSVDDIPLFLQPYNGNRYPVTSIDQAGIRELLRALRCPTRPPTTT
jgi:hypothetical protein